MATTTTAKNGGRRFVDADGHVLEHPTRLYELAPAEYKERIWHVETRPDGSEYTCFDGTVRPSSAAPGVAGMSAQRREAAFRGDLKYSDVIPGSYDAPPRLEAMDVERIDQSVLYPTMLLALAALPDAKFAAVQARTYNEWIVEYCSADPTRLFGVAALPQQDLALTAEEIYRAKEKGFVGVFLRPNPMVEGQYFDDPVYEPIWKALEETGLPVGFHPFLAPDLPGACRALHLKDRQTTTELRGGDAETIMGAQDAPGAFGNVYFTQAIANPFDMMLSITYLLAGGVAERHPDLKMLFLEANGGWIVPWLERLDHHAEIFSWDVPQLKMRPSEYFKRQCWISFDTDESTLVFTANSPLVGADRIVWASDFPHPDAKYPGTVADLEEHTQGLSEVQQAQIYGENATLLYGLPT